MSEKVTLTKEVGSAFNLLGKSADLVMRFWQLFAAVNILALIDAFYSSITYGQEKSSSFQFNGSSLDFYKNPLAGLDGPELAITIGFGAVFALAFLFVTLYLYTMTISLNLRAAKGETPSLNELFRDGARFWGRMFLLILLQAGIVIIGLLLLIVPGIIAISRVLMAPYVMLDREISSPWQAIKDSNQLAKSNMGAVWGVIGVSVLVFIGTAILGIIPYIGSILAAVFTILFSVIFALRYHQISSLKKSS